MFLFILEIFQTVIEANHASFCFADCWFSCVFELSHFLKVRILALKHQFRLFVECLFVFFKLLYALKQFFVQSTLKWIQLGYFLLIYWYYSLHAFESALTFDMILEKCLL